MKAKAFILILLGLVLAAAILVQTRTPVTNHEALMSQQEARPVLAAVPEATTPRFEEAYGKLPLSFEANRGQTNAQVKFLSRGRGYTLFLTTDEAVLTLRRGKPKVEGENSRMNHPSHRSSFKAATFRALLESPATELEKSYAPQDQNPRVNPEPLSPSLEPLSAVVLRMKLVGANPNSEVTGLDELPGKWNYFIGNDPDKWRTNVPNYTKVKYKSIYPGIDLVYYGNQRQLEYDFVVAPGADPKAIRLAVETGNSKLENRPSAINNHPLTVDSDGDLVIQTDTGEVRFHRPVVYQLSPRPESRVSSSGSSNPKSQIQNRKSVEGRYTLIAKNEVGFELADYDRSLPLVIDPVLSYSTYLGGTDFELAFGIAVDSTGNAYLTGDTGSLDFPTMNPLQPAYAGGPFDAFVAKLDAAGSALVYSTYLGGIEDDSGAGIAVDSAGNAYLTGDTNSLDFPTMNPLQPANAGIFDAFVAKISVFLSPEILQFGNHLVGSTSAEQNVTFSNPGQTTLNVSSIAVSRDFAETNDCGASVASGANCTIDVTFMPTATGAATGSVTITDDAPGSPHTVALTGTGTDFALAVQSGGSTSATVSAGQTATYDLQITPTGFSGNVMLACAFQGSTPRGASCSVSPGALTLNGSDPGTFTANVATTAPSSGFRSAAVARRAGHRRWGGYRSWQRCSSSCSGRRAVAAEVHLPRPNRLARRPGLTR